MDKKKRVLIVEDNELNLKLFQDLLQAHGCETMEVRDGREAVKAIAQERPDLVIMDIQLPHISGMEIIRQVKADSELKNIPIVAVTAFAMHEDEKRILSTGCEGYIAKPISIDSFLKATQKFLV